MHNIVREFVDEFDIINAACGNKLSCDYGVEQYCNLMKIAKNRVKYFGAEWNKTYRELLRLNRLYKHIVFYSAPYSLSNEDLEFLKEFHNKLLDGSDPLSKIGVGFEISADGTFEPPMQKSNRFNQAANQNNITVLNVTKFFKLAAELAAVTVVGYLLFK